MPLLTKSRYIQGIQCHKRLWLATKEPRRARVSDAQTFTFSQGTHVGEWARTLFKDGILMDDSLPFQQKAPHTTQALTHRRPIFEGAFLWQSAFCMVDIMVPSANKWSIIEVKSSKSVKPIHLDDLAFQYVILSHNNIEVDRLLVYTLNPHYIRKGPLDVNALFTAHDVTQDVLARIPTTEKNMHTFMAVLKGPVPSTPIGPHCHSPYSCPFESTCWTNIPSPSVFDLIDCPLKQKFTHFFQGRIHLKDLWGHASFTRQQRRQMVSIMEDVDIIQPKKIASFLSKLQAPVSYMDFECLQPAIPPMDDQRPYDPLPIMFSIHVQTPTSLQHYPWLSPIHPDIHRYFIEGLQATLPPEGSIVVYNRSLETEIIHLLATKHPNYRPFLTGILKRIVDLEVPIKRQWIYMRDFNGKQSLKAVYEGMVPDGSYDHLAIQSGTDIRHAYDQYAQSGFSHHYATPMLEYVSMDTLAMVNIIDGFRAILNAPPTNENG